MIARIYNPAKTAMQSGRRNADFWILEYEPLQTKMLEPLMGYTAVSDMRSQIKIRFGRQEEAVAFACRNGIPYRVEKAHKSIRRVVSYSDNFRSDRYQPWTH
ncbi:ETC complex I subunit [Bartonella sp. B39]